MNLPDDIFKAYDIRGIVGKTLTAPIVQAVGQALGTLAQERGRDTLVVGRDGRLSGPELAGALFDRHSRQRRERHRHRHGHDADQLLRRASSEDAVQRDGDRKPQSARLQRAQDGDRRRHARGRRDQGLAHAHRGRRAQARRRHAAQRRCGAGLLRPDRRRRPAGATDEDRRRLRQRRRGRLCADAVPPPGLRGHRAFLRSRRPLSEPSSGSVATGEPSRPDRQPRLDRQRARASPSTATATAWAWSPRTDARSTPTGS